MTYVHSEYLCSNGSSFGYFIAYITLGFAPTAWHGIKGLNYYDPQIVLLFLNIFWVLQYPLNLLLQETFSEKRLCKPVGDNNIIIYGNPSFETQLFFSFAVFVTLFNYMRNRKMKKWNLIGIITLCFFMIWGLWWTGNFNFLHLINGAIVGSLLGILMVLSIQIYLLEDFEPILNTKIMKKMGYKDSLCLNINNNNNNNKQLNIDKKKDKIYQLFFIEPIY
jgi:hypothetical protein